MSDENWATGGLGDRSTSGRPSPAGNGSQAQGSVKRDPEPTTAQAVSRGRSAQTSNESKGRLSAALAVVGQSGLEPAKQEITAS